MKRRKFIQNTTCLAFGVGIFGSISWEDGKFIGDTPTTTDILGPFYRPNAPFRTDINPPGFTGEKLHLSGIIYKEDGKTPFKNCMVEIWQCDNQTKYDNVSDNYTYRGRQLTENNGKYHFITTKPVPYKTNPQGNHYRPAHIHMRISAEGQQDLITQVYFKNDPYLESDGLSAAPQAASRILEIKTGPNNEQELVFNIILAKEFIPENSFFEKISGLYKVDGKIMEFYRDGDFLMMKRNGQIWLAFKFKGGNEFTGLPEGFGISARFEIQNDNNVKLILQNSEGDDSVHEGLKSFNYR